MSFLGIHKIAKGSRLPAVEILTAIIPWMFAMDHYHYARWLSVHVIDLQELPNDSPDTHREFVKGNFVTQKSSHKFSALAHDQIHEQQNALVKGDGGIVGITENEGALRRWLVAVPEIARILSEFEDQFLKQGKTPPRAVIRSQKYYQYFRKAGESLLRRQ